MRQYLDLINQVINFGHDKADRTGTGTRSIFGWQSRYNLRSGFPLLTTKKLFLRGIIEELLWILSGETNIKTLVDKDVHIWDAWADENGDLGPVYGQQWRKWRGPAVFVPDMDDSTGQYLSDEGSWEPGRVIDQVTNVIERIKTKPDDRRLIVSAWNPADVDKMALPPCHCFFQFYTRELSFSERLFHAPVGMRGKSGLSMADLDAAGAPARALDCQLYQRSCDLFLGVPFNIASYALLTMMVAQVVGMVPGEFIHTYGDAHIYRNHFDQVDLQLKRTPRLLPRMTLNPKVKSIFDFKYEDFKLEGYDPHPAIAAPVAV